MLFVNLSPASSAQSQEQPAAISEGEVTSRYFGSLFDENCTPVQQKEYHKRRLFEDPVGSSTGRRKENSVCSSAVGPRDMFSMPVKREPCFIWMQPQTSASKSTDEMYTPSAFLSSPRVSFPSASLFGSNPIPPSNGSRLNPNTSSNSNPKLNLNRNSFQHQFRPQGSEEEAIANSIDVEMVKTRQRLRNQKSQRHRISCEEEREKDVTGLILQNEKIESLLNKEKLKQKTFEANAKSEKQKADETILSLLNRLNEIKRISSSLDELTADYVTAASMSRLLIMSPQANQATLAAKEKEWLSQRKFFERELNRINLLLAEEERKRTAETADHQKAIEEAKGVHVEEADRLRQQNLEMKKSLDKSEEEVSRLKEDKGRLQQELAETQQAYKQLNESHRKQLKENGSLKKTLEEMKEQVGVCFTQTEFIKKELKRKREGCSSDVSDERRSGFRSKRGYAPQSTSRKCSTGSPLALPEKKRKGEEEQE